MIEIEKERSSPMSCRPKLEEEIGSLSPRDLHKSGIASSDFITSLC